MDVDRDGVAWTVLGSGQLAAFDRRKCKGPLNGPTAADGKLCPEGWTLYTVPGPNYQGNTDAAATDSNYYNWSDKFNALGLGENVQIATGNDSGALLALVNGKWSSSGFRIHSVSTRNRSTVGSTIRRQAGRAEDCGPAGRTVIPGITKAAKGSPAWRSTSRCVRSVGEVICGERARE